MPELPEVEIVKVGLQNLILGKEIAGLYFDWPKSYPNNPGDTKRFVVGAAVASITRRGKVLIFDLSSQYSLVVHLKMTGQLVYRGDVNFGAGHPTNSLVGGLPDRSTRVEIEFYDGSRLFFNDQRKFGWMKLLPTVEVPNIDFLRTIGPEPLEQDFSFRKFQNQLQTKRNARIKAVLLDQKIIAGIGNIYADESLWMAKIHPLSKVNGISTKRLQLLHQSIIDVLRLSIKKGGSTDRNYVNAEGKKGSYIEFAKVFRKDGQPCPRCGRQIKKIRVAGRGTHVCEYCQKPPKL